MTLGGSAVFWSGGLAGAGPAMGRSDSRRLPAIAALGCSAMMTSIFLAWYRAPRCPIRVGIAHVCGSAIRGMLNGGCGALGGSGVVRAGLDRKHAPGILHWTAGLVLAGSFRAMGCSGAPRRSCGSRQRSMPPGGPVAFGQTRVAGAGDVRLDLRRVNARR